MKGKKIQVNKGTCIQKRDGLASIVKDDKLTERSGLW